MAKETDKFYIFAGVGGAGKTTMANSMPGKGHIDRCDKLDELTMTCDYTKWPTTIDNHSNLVILTADMDVLSVRIRNRECLADIFETERALYYYDCRFREIASYYGIPIINTTLRSPTQTIWDVRRYDQPLTIPLRDMDAAYCAANFELIKEGESKRVYADPYNNDFCYIVLKDSGGLGAIRAENCRYFLNALRKNGIRHAYVAINDRGVIYSRRMKNINPLEVVVEEYVEGPGKHSYFGYRDNYADPEGRYPFGPYVRFNWRTPKHVNCNGVDVRDSCGGESEIGKDNYFNTNLVDKTISTKIIDKTVVSSVNIIEKQALCVYNTLKYYLSMVNLTIKDARFRFSEEVDGELWCWDEINQDCVGVASNNSDTHDKDLWRAGGSAVADILVRKWRRVVDEFRFDIHNPHCYDYVTAIEQCYLSDPNNHFVHTDHYMAIARGSNGRHFIVMDDNQFGNSLFTLNHDSSNRDIGDNYSCVEVPNIDDAIQVISNSKRGVMMPDFETFMENKEIPLFSKFGERVIVPINSLDEAIEVYNFHTDIAICVDFYNIDNDIHDIRLNNPTRKTFMVCDELEHTIFAWRTGCIPIIPPNIKMAVASKSICSEYVDVIYQHFDGTVVDRDRVRFSQMYFNDSGVDNYIFDRKDGTSILCIGDFSNVINTTNIVFSDQSIIKTNILSLYESTPPTPFSDVHLTNNVWDTRASPETMVTDFLSFLKFKGIDLRQVLNNINAERWNIFKDYNQSDDAVYIAVTDSKYREKTEAYIRNVFGIELLEPESPGSLCREHKITDQEKFRGSTGDVMGDKTLKFFMCKPKHIPHILSSGYVKGVVTYDSDISSVTDRGGFMCVKPTEDPSLSLCLIKRKGEDVVFPTKIASEYPREVRQYVDVEQNAEIVSISDSSEIYLKDRELGFSLADAIVERGNTPLGNNVFEVYKTLKPSLTIGLYVRK